MLYLLIMIFLMLITSTITPNFNVIKWLHTPSLIVANHAHHDRYPWEGSYPDWVEREYVHNWYHSLSPSHYRQWRRIAIQILKPPDAWWRKYQSGVPLDALTLRAAKKIELWVNHHVHYQYYYNTRYGAWRTLQLGYGNCCDHAHVMVALCRAAGVAIRYRNEIAYFPHWGTCGHVCVEVALPENVHDGRAETVRWVRMDPTNPQSRCVKLCGTYADLPF